MSEAEWLACTDTQQMLTFAGLVSARKLRLFACACCRRYWDLLADERSRRAVEVAERFADGTATEEELAQAHSLAQRARDDAYVNGSPRLADKAFVKTLMSTARVCQPSAAHAAAYAAAWPGVPDSHAPEADLLHDIFGNPFRSVSLTPSWLTWNGGVVVRVARSIYETSRFEDLPVLADALEEAGCTDADLLAHCRGAGEHVRGCWALSLLLGKP
jgi:hypothetical protein